MVYGTYNELVTGAFVNQRSHHWGPHIVAVVDHWLIIVNPDPDPKRFVEISSFFAILS